MAGFDTASARMFPVRSMRGGEPGGSRWQLPARLAMMAAVVLALSLGCAPSGAERGSAGDERTRRENDARADRLQVLLDELVGERPLVRGGLLLVQGPGFRFEGASGIAVEKASVVMRPGDQFAIDSIAKPITATVVLKLVESGALDLDDPIVRYLPEALIDGLQEADGRSHTREITIRHLLGHRSGIPDDWADPDFVNLIAADLERMWTPQETIDYVKQNCRASFSPGAGFCYSDVGYNILGLLVEKVTGQPLHVAQRELVFTPLGMDHTYRPAFEEGRPVQPGRAPSERFFGDLECSQATAVMTADWAGGGLISTPQDLNTFLRALVEDRLFEHPSTRSAMLRWLDSGPMNGYGLGVSRINYDLSSDPLHSGLGEVWGHAGSSNNFMYYWPSRDVTMIGTLNQIDGDEPIHELVARVMRAFLG